MNFQANQRARERDNGVILCKKKEKMERRTEEEMKNKH